jgi:hypothetical protein
VVKIEYDDACLVLPIGIGSCCDEGIGTFGYGRYVCPLDAAPRSCRQPSAARGSRSVTRVTGRLSVRGSNRPTIAPTRDSTGTGKRP